MIDAEIALNATGPMIGDVREGVAKDATLGERPVAGKTGTSETFFDAWFVGYEPQRLTGIWMGDGEEGATLDYGRKLNGLSGGITPAEIWKTYMQYVVAGEPVENFEGVSSHRVSRSGPQPRPKASPTKRQRSR